MTFAIDSGGHISTLYFVELFLFCVLQTSGKIYIFKHKSGPDSALQNKAKVTPHSVHDHRAVFPRLSRLG